MKYCMSAGLVLETSTSLMVNLVLGGDTEWKKLRDDCLWVIKKKKSLILREFKVLFNEGLSCIVSQGSSFKQDYFRF